MPTERLTPCSQQSIAHTSESVRSHCTSNNGRAKFSRHDVLSALGQH